jgi:hypothetical protein
VPSNEKQRDEKQRDNVRASGAEASEATDEVTERPPDPDPDAPGSGVDRGDDLEEAPEPNEPA